MVVHWFRQFYLLLLFIIVCSLAAHTQSNIRIGEWRTHFPYNSAFAITDAGDKIYCLGKVNFFSYDKRDNSTQIYDKTNGLSDVKVTNIAYNKNYKTLVVTYDNANIDLLINNNIINIPDIKRKDISGSKSINSVYFVDSLAYLSCDFGIVVLDVKNQQISDSYIIGDSATQIKVSELTIYKDSFYAATIQGVKVAAVNAPNLANYQYWTLLGSSVNLPVRNASHIITFRNSLIVDIKDTLYKYGNSSWQMFYPDPDRNINKLDTINGYFIVDEYDANYHGRLTKFDSSLTLSSIDSSNALHIPKQVIQDVDSTIWVADVFNCLVNLSTNSFISVNGPSSTSVSNLSCNNGNVWVATVPVGGNGGGEFYGYVGNNWSSYNQYNTLGLDTIQNINAVLADPYSANVYYGSLWQGMFIFNNGIIAQYDHNNSALGVQVGNGTRTAVTAFAVDSNQNLWIGNFGSTKPLVVKYADSTWKAFSCPYNLLTGGITKIVIDDNGYLWCMVTNGSGGILVYDPSGNQWAFLSSISGSGSLPSNEVLSIAKDKDGSIWVGTAAGIAVFYCPSSIFSSNGCQAQQILVTNGGFAGYLLSTQRVTAIAVDGGNRKWVGTTAGLWLFSADGTKQLANYTIDNSPLMSNNIISIAINGYNGEVFVGTDKGIISLRGEAIEAGDQFSANKSCVFPNPVKQTYSGPIAIRCLAENSQIKITDVAGQLVYQATATGGQAVWNGTDYNGRRPDTGVYLVYAVNKDGSQSFVTKFLFIH